MLYVIEPQVPEVVQGDVTRLRQVLMNLLSNAVKFTDSGEVVVTVTAQQLGRSNTATPEPSLPLLSTYANIYPIYELGFSVRDTGIGIPPNRLDRLFRSFSQVDTSTTRQYGGTGLGLAISKRLCEMMGGSLWVESHGHVGGEPPANWQPSSGSWQPGQRSSDSYEPQGATFHCRIVAPAVTLSTALSAQEQFAAGLAGKRLLIVDDNTTARQILTWQAQAWGMVVQSVSSGNNALHRLSQGNVFDVAIVDMQMPVMDGMTLATIVHQQPQHKHLPIVLLTSVGRITPPPEPFSPKLSAYLHKPIKPSQLYAALHRVLAPEHTTPSLPHPHVEKPGTDLAKHLPLRILLAEDHAVNQKLALLLLKRLGYRADVAGNGIEVLDALRRQFYDVILMDVQMPEMDGLAAARQICREWSVVNRPYIIALTASAMQGDREECLNAGMDDYITKPIQFEALVQVLKRSQARVKLQETRTLPQELLWVALERPVDRLFPEMAAPDEATALTTTPVAGMPATTPAIPVDTAPSTTTPATPIVPATPPLSDPILDPDTLVAIRAMADDEEDDFLADMIDCYLQDTPAQMETVLSAIAHNDAATLKQSSHPLKSMSAAVGANSFAALCHDLEVMAASGNITYDPGQVDRLQTSYQQVCTALEQLRVKIDTPGN